jgi:hypothetical protein
MTQDFAKPTTTRKPGAAKTPKTKQGKAAPTAAKKTPSKKPKKKNTTNRASEMDKPKRNKVPFFLSLIVLIAAFAYGLYLLQSVPPTQSPASDKKILSAPASDTQSTSKSSVDKPEKRFNFYDILPKSKVKAPKVDEYHFKEKSNSGDFYYMIQTGSFKNQKDAERQKATIAFKGVKANIRAVTSDSGSVWHRVETGPYTNRSTMNSVLDKLVSINIQPLVKKTKKDQ